MTPCRAFSFLLAAALLAGCAARQDVRVGLVLPLSGEQGVFGAEVERGARLALEDRERDGRQARRRVELVSADTAADVEEAAAAFRRLATEQRVLAVIGEVVSSRSLAMAPVADGLQVPMLSPTSTNPRVTQGEQGPRPYVFRACVPDPPQGTAMARFARHQLGLERVAIMRDGSNKYSVILGDYFRSEWRRLGGVVAAEVDYDDGDREFSAQLEQLQVSGAEAIYLPGYYGTVALIARQARAMGLTAVLLGSDGWDSRGLFELGGAAVEGAYFTNHFSEDDPDPRVQAFVRRYRAAYGESPGAIAALGFDAAGLLFDAVDRAASPTGPAIRDALELTRGFPAVTGPTTLDERHDGDKPVVVLRIMGQAARFAARVPSGATAPTGLPRPGD